MKKIINAILLALLIFILLNFIYSNMTPELLAYPMRFRFKLPGLFTLRSVAMPLGYVICLAFSAGIIFLAFIQALPELFRRKDHKRQEKRIKDLEDQLDETSKAIPARPVPVATGPISLNEKK